MRIGILADIHGHIENLSKALDRLRAEGVDSVVVLGDVIFDHRNATETVGLLSECGAVGVWGNHELGLCVDPDDDVREWYSESIMAFFATLQPCLELCDTLFSHTFPNQDARDPMSYYVGQPQDERIVADCFAQFPHSKMMIGHFHHWFAATPSGEISFHGDKPIGLDRDQRYFFVIDAVFNGFAAILDDERSALIPVRV